MFALVRDREALLVKHSLYIVRTKRSRAALREGTRNVKIKQASKGVKAYGVKWGSDDPRRLVCQGDFRLVSVNGRKTLLAFDRDLDALSPSLSLARNMLKKRENHPGQPKDCEPL
jgi:hypothetical protein